VRRENVLADEVEIGRPPPAESRIVGPITGNGDVIHQCIEPDIGDVVSVEREFDAPGQARLRTRNRKVFQGLLEKPQDFVAARARFNEIRMLLDVGLQPVLILAHAEEVVFFAEPFDRPSAVRAEAAYDIFFSPKPFIRGAIPSGVVRLVDVPSLV
jgi:hypothetical protein